MRTLRTVIASLLILVLTPIWASASPRTATTSLTETGERAIQDLRRCLGANDSLDVYYLIDKSGSLGETDPLNKRSEVLSDSLQQLASLAEASNGLKVSWNAAFFDDGFYAPSEEWFDLDTDAAKSAKVLSSAIQTIPPGGRTNWLEALTSAQVELAKQKRLTQGCQVLIWLTDGGLNVENDDSLSFAAMNSLCGQVVVPSGASPDLGNGPLFELRQAGVTVFGVLLDVVGPGIQDDYPERKTWMQALVEGSGPLTVNEVSKSVNCGDGTGRIPANHSAGAYIRAQSAADLSIQFLRLGGVVRGGSTSSINPDGSFAINPGVAAVTILTLEPASQIQLFDASGDSALGSKGVSVLEKAGATAIEIAVESAEDFGRWQILGTAPADTVLIAFSALTIEPSSQNALITGQASEIVVDAKVSDPALFSINDYRFVYAVYQVSGDGKLIEKASGNQRDFQMGSLMINLDPPASDSTEVTLRFVFEKLSTTVGQTSLASIESDQSLLVSLPESFPSFAPIPLDLGLLSGRLKAATGELVITAPVSGEPGSFCLPNPESVKILSDSIDRSQTWSWGFSTEADLDSAGCYSLNPGETAAIQISAQNSVTANSEVSAEVKIVLKDATGATLEVNVPMDLESERLINPSVYRIVIIILTLLALILPLIALFLINKATTKVEHGNELLKAVFPITTDLTNDSIQGSIQTNLKGPEVGLDQFKFLGPKPDASSFDISDQFKAVAKVSLNPFVAPWFELQAKDGYRVFTSKSGRKSKQFTSGEKAEFGGQLSKLWAVSIRESDLMNATTSTTDLSGTLTVFDRNSAGASPNFQERMVNVVNDAKLRSRTLEARKSIEGQSKSKPSKSAKSPEKESAKSAPNNSSAPPVGPGSARPGFSAPPKSPSTPPGGSSSGSGPSAPPKPPTGPKGPPSSPPTLS